MINQRKKLRQGKKCYVIRHNENGEDNKDIENGKNQYNTESNVNVTLSKQTE